MMKTHEGCSTLLTFLALSLLTSALPTKTDLIIKESSTLRPYVRNDSHENRRSSHVTESTEIPPTHSDMAEETKRNAASISGFIGTIRGGQLTLAQSPNIQVERKSSSARHRNRKKKVRRLLRLHTPLVTLSAGSGHPTDRVSASGASEGTTGDPFGGIHVEVTGGPGKQDEVVFFWSWEAAVIVSLPILCVAFLLVVGFFTRTNVGVRCFRFFKLQTTFDLELSRRIKLDLEKPHLFRAAEADTVQGEPKNEDCVGLELKYNSSTESFVSYYDTVASIESFNSQCGSEGGMEGSRKPWSAGRKGSSGSQSSSRRGSSESQRSFLKLWTRRKGSADSRASTDSQLSLNRRGSEESQRSFMKLWYVERKVSTDSQISADMSFGSRRGSSDSQWRQVVERHCSLDSSYGSMESQGSKEGPDSGEILSKRRDSPRIIEAALQEALYGRSKSLEMGEERRMARALSLIHEEDKDEPHP